MTDFRAARVSDAERAMLEFAYKLTRTPGEVEQADADRLRSAGFTDEAISDIVQIAALFNYYNRLADGLGIDDEPEWSG